MSSEPMEPMRPTPMEPMKPPNMCPMPRCMPPQPHCIIEPSMEKNENGCPKYPCGKITCEPKAPKVEPMEPVTVAPKPMEKHWEKVLRLYDENKDNKVSWSELIKAQPKLNTMEMKAIFNNISKNQGGLASYNDYIQFVKRSEEVKPMARPMMMDRRL